MRLFYIQMTRSEFQIHALFLAWSLRVDMISINFAAGLRHQRSVCFRCNFEIGPDQA